MVEQLLGDDLRGDLRRVTKVRRDLHFASVFLNSVWEETRGLRSERHEGLLEAALDNVGDLRYDYDEAWKAGAEAIG